MFFRCFLKRLGDNDDADVKKNSYAGFQRDDAQHRLNRAGQTEKTDKDAVQCGVAGARAEPFPTGMADVNRRRKHAAEQRRDHRTDAVGHERGKGSKAVAGGFRAFDVLQRADDVKNSHRQNHRKIIQKRRMCQRFPQRSAGESRAEKAKH